MPRSRHYFEVLTELVKNRELFDGENRFKTFSLICENIAESMGLTQVGVWLYSRNEDAFMEEVTAIRGDGHSMGRIVSSEVISDHMEKISTSRVGHFTSRAEIEEVLGKDYNPGITNVLYAVVYSDGEMVGIVSAEDREAKIWNQHDEAFLASCADLVGRVLEAEKRQIYSKELNQRIIFLEHNLKRRISELHEANNNLEFALESANAGRWTLNLKTDELILDRKWFEKIGLEGESLPKTLQEYLEVVHPDDRARILDELVDFRDGKIEYYETRYRLMTQNGIQWCMERGRLSRDKKGDAYILSGMNFDITALVHWERDLSISEAQLKSMIQSIPSPMAMLDRNLKMVAYSNSWVEEWKDYVDPITFEPNKPFGTHDWISLAKRALEGESMRGDQECIEFPHQNMWVHWLIKPWRDSDGIISGVVMMLENITSKKEAEMKLSHASKLSALGEMAGGIAHEINNPLSIIKGYLDLIKRHHQRGTLDDEILNLYLGKMDHTVGRISRIVSGMKRFSRESSMDEKSVHSIIRIIEDTFDICQEKINNNGILLEMVDESDAHYINCRPVEISQVLLNLINNSYYEVSGDNHPWIKVKLSRRDYILVIEISDSGQGISMEVQQKLFQPFFTTKEVGEGTGLGLSISKGIIEEHGGKIYYDNSKSNTCFVIELPLVDLEDSRAQQLDSTPLNS